MKHVPAFVCLLGSLAPSFSASADVALQSQSRRVETFAPTLGPDFLDQFISTGFSDFNAQLDRQYLMTNTFGSTSLATVRARQQSSVTNTRMTISSETFATGVYPRESSSSQYEGAIARSVFDIRFNVNSNTPYTLIGISTNNFDSGFGSPSGYEVIFENVGSGALFVHRGPINFPGPFSSSGVMVPGSYRLRVNLEDKAVEGQAGGLPYGVPGSSLFVDLFVPAPGAALPLLAGSLLGLRRRRTA